jgi:hypothetical protein
VCSLVVYFHGNAEVTTDYDSAAPEFAAIGASLMVVDFAGYGWSTGSPKISTLPADAEAVSRHLPSILAEGVCVILPGPFSISV